MAPQTRKINNEFYSSLGADWYATYDHPVALLRAQSYAELPWIERKIGKVRGAIGGATILDIGCGAGFVSNPLARAGHFVTGLDCSKSSLAVAGAYDSTNSVRYILGDARRLPFPAKTFDVVTAMDFLEHVENPSAVVQEISRILKPGGLFFFHTFNRTLVAWLVVIKCVEWFVRNTPENLHVYPLFITPLELAGYCGDFGLKVTETTGVRPKISAAALAVAFSGRVPPNLEFVLTRSLAISYLGYAVKENA